MSLSGGLSISVYSIVLLIFIDIHILRQTEKKFLQYRLFMMTLQVTVLMLVMDILSRFDGHPGTVYALFNSFGNFMIFLFNPVLPSLWLLYAHFQVFQDENRTKRWLYPLLAVNAVNTVMLIFSQFFGWFYYIDAGNIYHRGQLYWLPVSLTVLLTLAGVAFILANRKYIEKRYYLSLLFFPLPPFVCIFLQVAFYGIPFILNSVAFSLLVVFLNIQNHSINTDYLTGVYNRKSLERYMTQKIDASTQHRTFSAALIDLDGFKAINDTFGHDMGDDALVTAVALMRSCLKMTDFIARFGGDEFYIIRDISNREDMEETVYKIRKCVEKFNGQGIKPYRLRLSIGYAVYDCRSHMGVGEFQKQIDLLMYENKRANKELKSE